MNTPIIYQFSKIVSIFILYVCFATEAKAQVNWVVEENTSGFTISGSGSFTFANVYDEPYEDDFSAAAFIGRSEVGIDDGDYSFWVGYAGQNEGRILSIIGGLRMTDDLLGEFSFEGVVSEALLS